MCVATSDCPAISHASDPACSLGLEAFSCQEGSAKGLLSPGRSFETQRCICWVGGLVGGCGV
jgi:hypothetical protein